MDRSCNQGKSRYECFQNFTGKPTGTRPLGRLMRRWEDNVRLDLKEIRVEELG